MRAIPRFDRRLYERVSLGFRADTPWMFLFMGMLALVVAAGKIPLVRAWWTASSVSVTFALVSVAVGIASAISCSVIAHLTEDARGLWMGAAITLYSMIAIPAATLDSTSTFGDAVLGNVRLMAHTLLVILTFIAVFASVRPPWDGGSVLLGGLLIVAVVAGLGLAFPSASEAVNTSIVVRLSLSVFWVLSGMAMVLASWVRGEGWISWVGMGCTVIALAHVLRVVSSGPDAPLGVSFSIVRLFGVVLLFLGTAATMRRRLAGVHESYFEYQEKLRLAKIDLEEVEHRAHDVRNGLAGIAGVAALLDVGAHNPQEMALLRKAVNAELTRLDGLLRPAGAEVATIDSTVYAIEPMLCELTMLQANAGMDIRADVEPKLRATGDSSVIAQVLTNVLANCAQHAPGSPVRIQARRVEDRVEIRVRDFGAGLPSGAGDSVFEMGVRGHDSNGQGLGLHICRKLLAEEGGTIELRSGPQARTGCTALITLPAAAPEEHGGGDVVQLVRAG